MPFQKGAPKPEKSGRKAGVVPKRLMQFKTAQEACAARGLDPMDAWVELCHDPDKVIQIQALKELSKYMYVQKRAVELTGENGGPLKVQEVDKNLAEFTDLVNNLVNAGVKPKGVS